MKLTCLDLITSYIREGSYVNVPPEERVVLHNTLLDWIRGKDANEINLIPEYLKTKYSVLVTLLIKVDYPQMWPDVFEVDVQFDGVMCRVCSSSAPYPPRIFPCTSSCCFT